MRDQNVFVARRPLRRDLNIQVLIAGDATADKKHTQQRLNRTTVLAPV